MSEVTKVYELTVLLHPDLEIDLEKPLKKLEGIITDNGGKIVTQENQGKKRLAYQIKKQDFAVYVFSEVSIAPANANKVQSLLNITDEVLRYLMVEKDLKAPEVKAAKPSESSEEENKEG
jgi:small subunit ribosomal protein S6